MVSFVGLVKQTPPIGGGAATRTRENIPVNHSAACVHWTPAPPYREKAYSALEGVAHPQVATLWVNGCVEGSANVFPGEVSPSRNTYFQKGPTPTPGQASVTGPQKGLQLS